MQTPFVVHLPNRAGDFHFILLLGDWSGEINHQSVVFNGVLNFKGSDLAVQLLDA